LPQSGLHQPSTGSRAHRGAPQGRGQARPGQRPQARPGKRGGERERGRGELRAGRSAWGSGRAGGGAGKTCRTGEAAAGRGGEGGEAARGRGPWLRIRCHVGNGATALPSSVSVGNTTARRIRYLTSRTLRPTSRAARASMPRGSSGPARLGARGAPAPAVAL